MMNESHWFWVARDDLAYFVSFFPEDKEPVKHGAAYWCKDAKYPSDYPFVLSIDIFMKLFGWCPDQGTHHRMAITMSKLDLIGRITRLTLACKAAIEEFKRIGQALGELTPPHMVDTWDLVEKALKE